jgi:hypothetical protein
VSAQWNAGTGLGMTRLYPCEPAIHPGPNVKYPDAFCSLCNRTVPYETIGVYVHYPLPTSQPFAPGKRPYKHYWFCRDCATRIGKAAEEHR